jgi:hypothetical protein
MKRLIVIVAFIVLGIELGGMAFDSIQDNIQIEISQLQESARLTTKRGVER